MSNMGYCRFENTVPDLRDCYEHLTDTDLSETEERARKRLIKICRDIIEDAEFNGW
jgi:hypothetical protein